ncbi:ABC transporter ATP-binding protein [Deltaproteobacteria bacterium PRO3]|nr:ABC transporter ATP-binding protein [Deltaproteobacteria bacterium PRO3]
MAALIEAHNLHKTYGDAADRVEVLKGVDFAVEEGEAVAVLGASGAGKSTLLHLLGTLDKPTEGRVTFEGSDLFALSDAELSRFRNRTMGFVFQFHHLLPMLSARENVMLPLLIGGEKRREAEARAEAMLAGVGLSHRLEHKPSELSGGEQQRVAIARALIAGPRVLFADEPTGNLDSRTGEETADLLMKLHQELRMTLVVVTHNERLAQRLPRNVRMQDGRVQPA